MDHTVIRRLAFIKYLYQNAISQSHSASPLNCAALLTMHDAVELFLQLASEHLNTGGSQPKFMEYWGIINKKLASNELEQKESMRRLNKARVALKHHGTFPSRLDIESFRESTTNFFKNNTRFVFNIDLHDVSLVEFVNPESSREKLKDAQKAIAQNETLKALGKISVAFEEMISDFEEIGKQKYNNSPFYFGRRLASIDPYNLELIRGSPGSPGRSYIELVNGINVSAQ